MYTTPNYVKRYFMYNDKTKSTVSFPTKEELIDFIKNGTDYTKPQDIRVQAVFELNKIDLDLN